MFRFINTYTQFNLSTAKYIIRNKKYLIEAPPARPTTSWGLFVKEQTTGISGLKVTEKMTELSKKWAQNPQLKEKYGNQAKKNLEQYQKLSSAYEKKYPQKNRINFISLYMSKLFADRANIIKEGIQLKTIQDYSKLLSQKLKKISTEEKTSLINQANGIKDANKAFLSQYQFPQKKFLNPLQLIRSNAELYQKEEINKKKAYKKWQTQWQQSVAKWLQEKGYDLSVQNFVKLHKKAFLKKKSQPKEQVKTQTVPSPVQTLKVVNTKKQAPVDKSKKKTKKGAVSAQ